MGPGRCCSEHMVVCGELLILLKRCTHGSFGLVLGPTWLGCLRGAYLYKNIRRTMMLRPASNG